MKIWLMKKICKFNPEMEVLQGDHLNMAALFGAFQKWLVQCLLLYTYKLNKSRFRQKNTAMFNWSPCNQIQRFHSS